MEDIYKRIGKKIDLEKLNIDICKTYNLGNYIKYKIIYVGIDDFSIYLWTDKGEYIVKNFNESKTIKDINRFINQYEIMMKNGIKVPKLMLNGQRHIFISEIDGLYINSCVIECIDGKDLYSIGKIISREEIDMIVDILVKIHSIKDELEIEYDEYCFMKIKEVYNLTSRIISGKLKNEVKICMSEFDKIDFSKLPKTYVHGDFISTNIIKDKEGRLWVIDFTSSGTGIRILDIIKVLNSVIFNYKYISESKQLGEYFIKKYQEHLKLTKYELEVLRILRLADSYVGVMLGQFEKNNDEYEETDFWLNNDASIIGNI
ncbi:MAG: phosphotransferase [Clostridia bacterium]|nr:phosphotransferase [Clostridia bacterium]